MERNFAWPAPKGAMAVVSSKDGRTYKASGVHVFRIPNLGCTRITWTGGRRFQWKAAFKFNNGQTTIRSGTRFKTFSFDIVLPRKQKYIVIQLTGLLGPVYTDYIAYDKLIGKPRKLSDDRVKYDPKYDYIDELTVLAEKAAANGDSGSAWCMLKNAVTLGQDDLQIRHLLKKNGPPNLKNSADSIAADKMMKEFVSK